MNNNVIELRPQKSQPANDITMYLHCGECMSELLDNEAPCDYQQLEVGWTDKGWDMSRW